MKTNNQATIIDIQPKVLPLKLKKIWLSVIGKDLKPDADVILLLGKDRYPIPKRRIRFIDSSLIQVGVFLSKDESGFDIEIKQRPSRLKPNTQTQKNKQLSRQQAC